MLRQSLAGMTPGRLRLWLSVFFVTLAIPTAVLIHQAYTQIKWQAVHQHRALAEEFAARVDTHLMDLITVEETRSFGDYRFLVVAGDASAGILQRSSLSAFPVNSDLPGVIGYFQIDEVGSFSTPVWPQTVSKATAYGISEEELRSRWTLHQAILRILSQNRLLESAESRRSAPGTESATAPRGNPSQTPSEPPLSLPSEGRGSAPGALDRQDAASVGTAASETMLSTAPESESQDPFDDLDKAPTGKDAADYTIPGTLGKVEELVLDRYAASAPLPASAPAPERWSDSTLTMRSSRKELSALPELPRQTADQDAPAPDTLESGLSITSFESELDPFELRILSSGHFVLFRKVWRNGKRHVQGLILDQRPFLTGALGTPFLSTALSGMSSLMVAYRGEVIANYTRSSADPGVGTIERDVGTLLYQSHLGAPLDDISLVFSVNQLPAGPGQGLVAWTSAILILVLGSGFLVIYRLGVRQIELTRQQQDFVSAVSHELRTPLTSIRMYAEILREGWANEERSHIYYNYIHDESGRLSRLISNVLQLARMTRRDPHIHPKTVTVREFVDEIRSKVGTQIERAGFELHLRTEGNAASRIIEIDQDCFAQILINLVDNALKFAAEANPRRIDIVCSTTRDQEVCFTVRDYGPGISRAHLTKVFGLFYRSENDLSRATSGTGIGLALVKQLTVAMRGRVEVVNRHPGAEFRLTFPTLRGSAPRSTGDDCSDR